MRTSLSHRIAAVLLATAALGGLAGCHRTDSAASASPPPAAAVAEPPGWREGVESWHRQRIERLKREDGWLSLVALLWLKPGANTLGSAADNTLVMPAPAPAHLGTITVADGRVRFRAAEGVDVRQRAQPAAADAPGATETAAPSAPVADLELATDAGGQPPTVLTSGTLSFQVIARGDRLGVRVKDSASPLRQAMTDIPRYPVDPKWRVVGRFEPYDPPRTIAVPTVLGTADPMPSPGRVRFTVDGRELSLDVVLEEGETDYFLVFGDDTNRSETYGGGRFLYARPAGSDGTVVLDFNQAYNPPCTFTPYATCPLPPPGNKLPVRVEAGEKRWGNGHPHGVPAA